MLTEEQTLHTQLKAALAIASRPAAYDVMTALAALYIAQGNTQAGADVLAFLLIQPDIAPDTLEHAQALFEELETHICPRVILDAREFARDMLFEDILDYIFTPI
jgi:hypothetical protein